MKIYMISLFHRATINQHLMIPFWKLSFYCAIHAVADVAN